MATINFRYDEEAKKDLEKEGKDLGYSSLSEYMIAIIDSRPKGKTNPKKKKKVIKIDKDGQNAKTRVNRDEKKRLVEIAQEEGETESFLLLRQIRILINNGPHFSKEEVKSLRMATTQLTSIGRNLNQIVTQINSGKITDSKLSKAYILKMKEYIDNQAKAIKKLIRKTKDRIVE